MIQLKNKTLLYIGAGVVLLLAVSVLFVTGLDAESEGRFKRSMHSSETKDAIHTAFEDGDYDAYVTAITEKHEQLVLTENEFASRVEKMVKKQQIHDAFVAADHETYLTLTDGSIHQLSEAAFYKKSKMLALKEAIRTALKDRNYDSFIQKRQDLKDLLGDEHMDDSEEVTEERFNMLADRSGQYDAGGFSGEKYQGCPYSNSKHGGPSRHHW